MLMSSAQMLSVFAALLMFVFGGIVLQRYFKKRQIFNLFWGAGLLMFGIGAFAEGYLFSTWSEPLFRAWYLFGAMLNAGWLGHGSLTLLVRRPWVRALTIGIVALSLIGAIAVLLIPLNASAYAAGIPISDQYKSILPKGAPVRLLTPLFNVYGTIFLVGGAFFSAVQYSRKQAPASRVAGNLLIAIGALVIAAAGTLTRLVFGGLLPVSELIAAVLMFSGFILASAPAKVQSAESMAQTA
jgi:hypothetical protein